ncbi:MAG: hypothetical protein GY722_20995 [bacterium]|nr:hypothetical protein [bacterium]
MDKLEKIACVAHEANRGYCMSIGDDPQPFWADAPAWQRESAVAGVQNLIDNPDAPPSRSHECWLEHKRRDGWVYGPVKDPATKQHPCMVEYDELPEAQRLKDSLFVAVVKALL